MIKETIICIVIVIMIFTLDVCTQKYTEKSVETMTKSLESIKTDVSNHNVEVAKEKIIELDKNWHNMHDKLAYYIEHDELEKLEIQLISIRANINVEDYDRCIEELEKCKFMLEHIKDKDALQLVNIF